MTAKWGAVTLRLQRAHPCAERHHMTYRLLRSVNPFLQLTILPIPQNPMRYNAFQWSGHFQNCPFPCGYLDLHMRHGSFCPPMSTTQTASRLVQLFLHSSRQIVIGHVRVCPSPSQLSVPMGDLDPHLIYGSLSLPEPTTQLTSRSIPPFLQGS